MAGDENPEWLDIAEPGRDMLTFGTGIRDTLGLDGFPDARGVCDRGPGISAELGEV